MIRIVHFFGAALAVLFLDVPTAFSQDVATLLMNSTFEIVGPGAVAGQQSLGTVFLLGKPTKADPKRAYYVLVTAAHVLDGITGDHATVVLRHKNESGNYSRAPRQIDLRHDGINLYLRNPEADVAAMYIQIPENDGFGLVSMSLLATDTRLNELEVGPGDELQCLGFPLAIDLNGFPVIRSGLLASYPITPMKSVHSLYYNFHVFKGNSGGPVYFRFSNRAYQATTHLGNIDQGIIGLVSKEVTSPIPGYESAPLDISVIVPSAYIIDTINMLPEAPAN